MRIVMAASEAAPFAKTGGLADVVGALPRALKRLGIDVSVIIPAYRSIDSQRFSLQRTPWGAPSRATVCVRPTTAALDEQ